MESFKELSFVAFVFIHQSHSPLCSFFTKTKSTKNTIKTVPTYYFNRYLTTHTPLRLPFLRSRSPLLLSSTVIDFTVRSDFPIWSAIIF